MMNQDEFREAVINMRLLPCSIGEAGRILGATRTKKRLTIFLIRALVLPRLP